MAFRAATVREGCMKQPATRSLTVAALNGPLIRTANLIANDYRYTPYSFTAAIIARRFSSLGSSATHPAPRT